MSSYSKNESVPNKLAQPKYRADIDGLRGISIILVVCFHMLPNYIKGGFIGVDVFFVISGFLISSIIFQSLDSNNFSFIVFYSRRIKRIFPALLLVLYFCYTIGWFVLIALEYRQLGKHIFGGAGFVSNFVLRIESGYFDTVIDTKPLMHLWSLGVEEQYYIIWPCLLWVFWKRRFNLLAITVIFAISSFVYNLFLMKEEPTAAFYLPQTRFWELMIGSILAYVSLYKKSQIEKFGTYKNIQSIIGAALIILSVLIIEQKNFPGAWALLPTLGAFLIIIASENSWLNRVFLSNRFLVWIGLISFPLYMWHWPLLSFARIIESETPSIEIRLIAVIVAIILSWVTYKFVEQPIRRFKNDKLITIILVALLVIIGFIGINCYLHDGFRSRFNNLEYIRTSFEWDNTNNENPECRKKYPGDQYCNITDIHSSPTAAIIGDSHANQFFYGLSEYYKKRGGNLLNLGAGACAPFFEIDRGPHPSFENLNCYKRTKPMYDYILKNKNIKTVVLAFDHTEYFREDVKVIDKLEKINSNDNYRNVVAALIRTIKTLEQNGKDVILIYDMPHVTVDPTFCYHLRPVEFKKKTCKIDSKTIFKNDFDKYKLMISEVIKKTRIKVFDTHKYLKDNFPIDKNGIPTYRDNNHLSIAGSLFFSDKYSF